MVPEYIEYTLSKNASVCCCFPLKLSGFPRSYGSRSFTLRRSGVFQAAAIPEFNLRRDPKDINKNGMLIEEEPQIANGTQSARHAWHELPNQIIAAFC